MPRALQYICDLQPYEPGKPIELVAREYGVPTEQIIKLASNENPFGPSPKALQAFQAAAQEIHRYPEQYELLQALSSHLGVDPKAIVLGNGSNDVLDLVARTYLSQDDDAISSEYAFAIYPIATQSTGAKNIVVPAQEYGHDLEAMVAAITPKTKIIWIANPNNPTGTFIPYPEIKQFLQKVPKGIVVVLDEAYYEYLDPENKANSISWLSDHPNLILVRTFSKIYGLAGLRIGYGIASPEIADLLNRVRHPFNVNRPAVNAAIAALEDKNFAQLSYQRNKEGLAQIQGVFDKQRLQYLPAYANFITVRIEHADEVNQSLLRKGVVIRPLTSYKLPEFVRITIGTTQEINRFTDQLVSAISA